MRNGRSLVLVSNRGLRLPPPSEQRASMAFLRDEPPTHQGSAASPSRSPAIPSPPPPATASNIRAHRKNNRPKTGDLKVRRSCFRVDDGAEIRSRTEQVIEADNGLLAIDPHLVESRPIPGRRLLPFSVCATPTSCSAAAPRRCAAVPARPWRSLRPRTPGRSATRCPGCGPTPRRPSPACRGARSGRR